MFLEEWQDALARNIKWLQRHQGQLVQLLEFAQRQNSAMMRAMYTLGTEKKCTLQPHRTKKQRFHPALRLIRRPDHAGVI